MVEEIRLLASLNHPNIIAYYEAFCDHDKLCVVTEIVQGGDLGTFIRQVLAAVVGRQPSQPVGASQPAS